LSPEKTQAFIDDYCLVSLVKLEAIVTSVTHLCEACMDTLVLSIKKKYSNWT
jgi:hypothetical protein